MIGILIAEDEAIVAIALDRALRQMRYSVTGIADTGEEAIRLAQERRPNLVLMDIKLKGDMDGVQAAAQIQARYDVPVVYLTAYADEQMLQRASQTAVYGYILKPFQERELKVAIEMAVHKHNMERRLKERERWLSATVSSVEEGILAADALDRVKYLNAVAERLTGRSTQEALGQRVSDVVCLQYQAGKPDFVEALRKVFRTRQMLRLPNRVLARDSHLRVPVTCTITPILNERQEPDGLVVVLRDLTDVMEAGATLRVSEHAAGTPKGSGERAIAVLGPDGTVAACSTLVSELSGLEEPDVIGKRLDELPLLASVQISLPGPLGQTVHAPSDGIFRRA